MPRLEGKVVIVTGATSGIGRRTAELFATEGAAVVIAGRRTAEGEMLAKELGSRALFVRTDVTQEEDVKNLIARAVATFGWLDCLFNNAGGGTPTPPGIENVERATFDAVIALNLTSVVLGMKHAASHMKRQKSGSIINNASIGGLRVGYSGALYSTAKAAVIHMTRCVATELGGANVRVNSISPGAIVTGIFGKSAGIAASKADETSVEVMTGLFENVQPIPRAGTPDDIARAALWLASDDSTFVTGQNIIVDGGLINGRLPLEQQEFTLRMRDALNRAAVR